ncbi:MAG: PIG-L family deacetylase [Anaerolineae bacterium]|nr:PIG-L family deacetylase [Anaerolineae bacterium]
MKPPANNAHRMLISFAHPDDESFGMGGAIALYAQRGVDITLICSTNGDVGTVDPQFMNGFETVGELRLHELQCAAETLGIKEIVPFGYRDSGMMGSSDNDHPDCLWQADEDIVTGRIVETIRRVRPQVVVTFDPFGGYGHPDHIFMHRTTTRAFHAAADPDQFPDQIAAGLEPYQPAKLYYNTFPRWGLRIRLWMLRLQGENPRALGKNKDLDLVAVMEQMQPRHTRIKISEYQQAWDDAAQCHASQLNPRQTNTLFDKFSRLVFRHQDFTRVYPVPNGRGPLERDLFAGVEAKS